MKLADYLTPRPCRCCGQFMSKEFLLEKHQTRIKKQSESLLKLAASGKNVGRYRQFDYTKIRELRDKGMTMRLICHELKCGLGTVQNALKDRK